MRKSCIVNILVSQIFIGTIQVLIRYLLNKGNKLMTILIALLICVLVVVFAFWLIDNIALPHPANMIAKAIVAIIALFYILQHLGFALPG